MFTKLASYASVTLMLGILSEIKLPLHYRMHQNLERLSKICMTSMGLVHTKLKRLFLARYGRLFISMKTLEGPMLMQRSKWKIFLDWILSKYWLYVNFEKLFFTAAVVDIGDFTSAVLWSKSAIFREVYCNIKMPPCHWAPQAFLSNISSFIRGM